MADMPYAAHEHLVAPCRPRREIWRILVGLLIVAITLFVGNAILVRALSAAGSEDLVLSFLSGSSVPGLLILLASFGFLTVGVALAARQMQRRGLQSVTGNYGLAARQFWRVLRLLVVLAVAIFLLPPYDMGAPLLPNLDLSVWLLLLPVSLFAVLVQVSAEEILFRGYLQQSLAARFDSPLIWMILPSALFAIGHYLPSQAGENAWLIAVWSGVFGVLMADLTARAGTLGPAIALHLFNNAVALLVVALPDSLSGLALYLIPFDMSDTGELRSWLIVDFVLMVLGWLTARIALRR